jgi:hypothetical protein
MIPIAKGFKWFIISLIFVSPAICPSTLSCQTSDSVARFASSGSIVQIQLFNGFGANYIRNVNPTTGYRIGVDVSFHYGESSGPGETKLGQAGGFYVDKNTTRGSDSSSHEITVSALLLSRIIDYSSATLYWGIGPTASYQYTKSTSTSNARTNYNSPGDYYISNSSDDQHSRTMAMGAMVLLGIRGRVIGTIGLTAEVEFRAMYEWIRDDGILSTYEMTDTWTNSNVQETHTSGSYKGWSITLASVRVGVTFEL